MIENLTVGAGMAPGTPGDDARRADAAGDEGSAGNLPPASSEGTGCAPPAAADVERKGPKPPQTLREFERALRTLGFSQRQAAHIARGGFKAIRPEPDATDIDELRAALERRAAALKG